MSEKAHCRGAIALGEYCPIEATTHEPLELGSRVSGDAHQIAHQHALVGSVKLAICKAPKYSGDEPIAPDIVVEAAGSAFKYLLLKCAHMYRRVESSFAHIDHHVVNGGSKIHASGSCLVGNANPRSGSCPIGIGSSLTLIFLYERIVVYLHKNGPAWRSR